MQGHERSECAHAGREIAVHAQPAKPGSDEGGAAGEHGGMALPRHHAVNERTCRHNCCLWTADVAEAVFVDTARAVPRR